jgi:hypothetical protein
MPAGADLTITARTVARRIIMPGAAASGTPARR